MSPRPARVFILRVWREGAAADGELRALVIDVATRERTPVGSWETLRSLLEDGRRAGPGAPAAPRLEER